jgi:putative ABC transport system permease protein
VAATYAETSIFELPVVSTSIFDQAGASSALDWVGASLATGVSPTDAAPSIAEIQGRYPQIEIQTTTEFREQFEATIDSGLAVVNAMLALAIVIALIGIANTLALSVSERTRELGLLRAVGMTRRQVRRMVRWEAALVASFGAVLGAVIGIGFGWALVVALPADFAGTVSVPAGRIIVLMLVAGFAGLVAAALPARRAGRLNVLDAISH